MADRAFPRPVLSRRRFTTLAAGAIGSLARPSRGAAATTISGHDAFDPTYDVVHAATPPDRAVPTLVGLSDSTELAAVESIADGAITIRELEPAAFARLTGGRRRR